MSGNLLRRLEATQPKGMLSGCMDCVEPVNPDGAEAAAEIRRLLEQIEAKQVECNEAWAKVIDAEAALSEKQS